MKKMTIIAPNVHFANFILYYALSLVCRVKTYEIHPALLKFGRIKVLDLLHYLDWDECVITREEAVGISEDVIGKLPASGWAVRIRGRKVDMSIRIKQSIFREVEKYLYLKKISSREKEAAYLVDSVLISFLSSFSSEGTDFFDYPKSKALSCINVFLDRLNLFLTNTALFSRTFIEFMAGLARNRKIGRKVRYLYNGENPFELSLDRDKMTFAWLIDNGIIKKEDTLFVLPVVRQKAPSRKAACAAGEGMLTVRLPDIFKAASVDALLSCLPELVYTGAMTLLSLFSFKYLLLAPDMSRVLRWVPLVESLSPKVYISSFASAITENPAVLYFNEIGIRSVSWFYSTSTGRFLTAQKPDSFRFRDEGFCNIMSETLIVWNRNFRDFVMEHPQSRIRIETVGPLMPGDESVLGLGKKELCEKFGIPYGPEKRYITVFDAPVAFPKFKSFFVIPSEYKYAFLKHIVALTKASGQDTVFLLKTKRDLDDPDVFYPDEIKELINSIKGAHKVFVLKNTINPWVPIALADLCINLPFGSTSMAALHYGKPIIFHDPFNIARYPRYKYDRLGPFITHNFDELKETASRFLSDPSSFDKVCAEIGISDYIGKKFKSNSTVEFRKFLNGLAG